jgi:hypothetical protein
MSGISPNCRVVGAGLRCKAPLGVITTEDAAAPAWQNIPADYMFRHARARGEPRPHWNPYIGSGFPISLDGHNSPLSPTQWLQSRIPGDQGRDIVIYARFLLWTFAITWLVSFWGASTPLLAAIAMTATLAPYAARYIDIVFLDADLLSPWFVLILFGLMRGRLGLRAAALCALALGLLIGTLSFQQAHVSLCCSMGLLALAAAPATRGRSLLLAAALGVGVLAVVPVWLPLVCNLDQYISARSVQCVARSGVGFEDFVKGTFTPTFQGDRFAFVTAVGLALLLFVPARLRFLMFTLYLVGAWEVFGLPASACALPVVSGIRYVRHLLPHLQMLFIVGVGVTIAAVSRRLELVKAWMLLAAAQAGALFVLVEAHHGSALDWAELGSMAATLFALLAAGVYTRRWRPLRERQRIARGLFDFALAVFAFTPLLFATGLPVRLLDLELGAPQMKPLPNKIDQRTPLGQVQKLCEEQDRRHYSPGGFLAPNWSEAIGILDILSLNAFYPIGYHELNAGLYKHWDRDPQHVLNPDRFVHVLGSQAMGRDFQRVLAAHHVSLLTFRYDEPHFAPAPSPYEAGKCRLLARNKEQRTESYVCPDIPGIGYFPSVVRAVSERRFAIDQLRRMSPDQILGTALIGPETDLSLGKEINGPLRPALGRVRSFARAGDDLSYQLEVEQAGMFVITDTYFRGWSARVNGQPAGISRANVAFKAVRVPAGAVELKLHFKPLLF